MRLPDLLRVLFWRPASGAGLHVVNPAHEAALIEPRALPLVQALSSVRAVPIASCAGHGHVCETRLGPYWPHFAFVAEPDVAVRVARVIHQDQSLRYCWRLVGYFMPSRDFRTGYALSVADSKAFRTGWGDADIRQLGQRIQAISSRAITTASMPIASAVMPALADRFLMQRHSEQKP